MPLECRVLSEGGWELSMQQVRINDIQFGFIPGRSTTDDIFILHLLQNEFHAINKALYVAFVALGKALYRVAIRVIWCGSYRACMKMPEAQCVLVATWVHCESGSLRRLLPEPPTVHQVPGSPLPRVSYRMSMEKPVCRWPVYHHWLAGGTAREADPLED